MMAEPASTRGGNAADGTKVRRRAATLTRVREHARGARWITRTGDARFLAEPPVRIHGTLTVRSDTHVGGFTEFGKLVEIQSADVGRYGEIGPGCLLGAISHPTRWLSVSAFQYRSSTWSWHPSADAVETLDPSADGRTSFRGARGEEPAVIGNDVHLGANVVVLKGVHIGDGCVVAAGAVVTRALPPYSVAAGLPARVLRRRLPDDVVADLLELRWWRFSPNQLSGVPFDDPRAAAEEVRRRVEAGLEPYDPGFVEIVKPASAPARPPAPRWRRALGRLRG